MSNGKLQILSAILKIDRPFRPPHIIDMTGLDRQLVRYHLTNFCSAGYLEKIDKVYVLKDREGLFDSLTEVAEKIDVTKMQPGGFFTKSTVDAINSMAENIVSLRMLSASVPNEARDAFVRKIDITMKELKVLRKFLMNSQRSEQAAAKRYMKADLGEIYDEWVSNIGFTPTVNKKEWVEATKEEMEKWND